MFSLRSNWWTLESLLAVALATCDSYALETADFHPRADARE
jgi:hypothetical protein